MSIHGKIYNNVLETVGNTPMVNLGKISKDLKGNIVAKLEMRNPLGSVKDRISIAMIDEAEKQGELKRSTTIIEPTSGNTGIGLAMAAAVKGYRLILTMPDTMSQERRDLLSALGAEVVLTPGKDGMAGAVKRAEELVDSTLNVFMPQQFKNSANPDIHKRTTALEIWKDAKGKIDYFVAGVGTGGTITGIGSVLKAHDKNVQIIAVEPADSPVLSGGNAGPHKIQGIGAGFVPKILDVDVIDDVIEIKTEDAVRTTRLLAREEGILAGISSGAALWGAILVAGRDEAKDKQIVVVLPDTGERYLSTDLFRTRE